MDIVDRNPDDITLDEAAQIACRCTKTLRRAIKDGHFPRRYVLGPRGLQLVFRRADLDRWLADRQAKPRTGLHAYQRGAQRKWSELSARAALLQTLLDESRDTIAELTAELHNQDGALLTARAAVSQLVDRLAKLEAEGAQAQPRALEPEPTPQEARQ